MKKPAENRNDDGPYPAGEPKNISCRRFVAYAALLAALFFLAHLAGFREYASVLSGTGEYALWPMFRGVVYILLYFGFIGLNPVLMIAAALVKTFAWLRNRRSIGAKALRGET